MSGKAITERWLAQKLAGITHQGETVRVYRYPIPTQASYPFIVINSTGAVDLHQVGNTTDYERLQYQIRVFDKSNSALRVHAIAKDIHTRINHVEPTFFDDGYVVSCHRVGALAFDVVEENGELFQVDGGIYQFDVVTYN